mmetsp:Transcript_50091/g.109299  ORF Transcript_50091/g.109299 Transcript_50091/m.109299 type:complete len:154 (-) Transcript_50091:90-551(-)
MAPRPSFPALAALLLAMARLAAASWSCQMAQSWLRSQCERSEHVKTSCVAGTYVFDFGKSKSNLHCVPDNPFVIFPDPGNECTLVPMGGLKYEVTFHCWPELTELGLQVVLCGFVALLLCCCCQCYLMRRSRRLREDELMLRTQGRSLRQYQA